MPKKTGKPYIYLRKDGRYEGRYKKWITNRDSIDSTENVTKPIKKYKYVSVYGSTYEEAYEKVLHGMNCEKISRENNLLVLDLLKKWFSEIHKTMKPSSYALYQNYANKYILPKIGNRYADTIDENTLSAVLKSIHMRTDDLAPLAVNTVYIIEEIIRGAFRYGAEKNLIPKVSFGKAKYRPQNTGEVNPLSEWEIQHLLSVLKQQKIEIQISIILPLYAGLSLSELCGLKWEDIDLELGRIYIHRNVKRIQQNIAIDKKDSLPKKESQKKTATIMAEYELQESECREFEMPESVWNLLKEAKDFLLERKNAERKLVSKEADQLEIIENLDDENLVNNKQSYENYYIVSFNKKCPEGRTLQYRLKTIGLQAGIEELNFRMLRDTFAVMCLQVGGDIYNLAYILGITVSTACERYGAWIIKDDGFLKRIG